MKNNSNLNFYILSAAIIHAMFLFSFSLLQSINDITTTGETGVAVQMILLQEEDDVYDQNDFSQELRKAIEDKQEDNQVIMDNRKQGENTNYTYDTYYGRIREIIDNNKRYPLLSRQRREEGSPIIKFTILKDGSIDNLTVISSGYRSLDREAKRMIIESAPFPKIPDSISKDGITLTIPINFTLNTY